MTFVTPAFVSDRLIGHTTAICGDSKGCGKTTALRWAWQAARSVGPVALLTIGIHHSASRRGSTLDETHSVAELQIDEGDVVLTTLPLAKQSPASLEILALIPGRTHQGRLVLGRAHRRGTVNLVGPEHFSALQQAAAMIKQEGWASTICIDGAANRLTQLSAWPHLQFLYTIQVRPDNIEAVLERLHWLDDVTNLPCAATAATTPTANTANTAEALTFAPDEPLTETVMSTWNAPPARLIIEDFSKIFLSWPQWQSLRRTTAIYVRQTIPLLAVILIERDLERQVLEERTASLRLPLLHNPLASLTPTDHTK